MDRKWKETETEWNDFVKGEKLAKSISMSLVSIHRNTSIFYGLWHYFFNKIRNLPCFVFWPKCGKSVSRKIYFLIYKVLWLLSYLIYKFLGIPHKFSLPGFQKLFCILIFGIRFLYNSFCDRRINWYRQIFWNRLYCDLLYFTVKILFHRDPDFSFENQASMHWNVIVK